jgi:hypothetical protein
MHSKRKSLLGNIIPSHKKAWLWCLENLATISIKPESFSETKVRVTVRVGGYNPVDTLEECIADINQYKYQEIDHV